MLTTETTLMKISWLSLFENGEGVLWNQFSRDSCQPPGAWMLPFRAITPFDDEEKNLEQF
jgi:hypothetical protein